jgi:tetratricopeptide (TPR) repeat protein
VNDKQKKVARISGGVALALVIGIAVSPLPAWLSNYVDMLQAMRAFGKANEAYGRREYEDAIRYYAEATANAPDDNPLIQTTLRFFSASSHHLLYSPTTFDDPENEDYLDAALDGYEDTLDVVETALADPNLDEASREGIGVYERYASEQLAGIHRDHLDDLEGAEHYFNRLIELDPDTPERYYGLADVYERFHDPDTNPLLDKAIAAYEVPVQKKPDDPIGYRQVANLLNKYGRFDETMEWLGRARDVNPANPEGYYLIATYYWDKVYRDPDLTERERREFIDLGIEQLDLALERNDEYVDALVYKNLLLRELAKVDPRNASALVAEADEYRSRAIAIRDRLAVAAAAAAAAAAEAAAQR